MEQLDSAALTLQLSVVKNNTTNAWAAGTLALGATSNWWGTGTQPDIAAGLAGKCLTRRFSRMSRC